MKSNIMGQLIFQVILAIIAEVCGQIPGETPTDFLNTAPQVNTITTRTVMDRSTSTGGGVFPGGTTTTLFRQGPLDRGFTLQQENVFRQVPVDGIIPSEPRRTLPRELPLGDPLSGRTLTRELPLGDPLSGRTLTRELPLGDPLSGQPGRPLQVDPRGQCPTFLSRYEGDILVINLVPGTCDMLIFVQDQTHLFPAAADILLNTGSGRILLPMVSFRGNSTTESIATDCPMIPLRYLGPRIVLDTIPGRCQIVLGIRRFPILDQPDVPGFPAEPRWVTRAVFERTSGIL
nr:uncharacterized protein LOC105319346 [Crassostrea gigas]